MYLVFFFTKPHETNKIKHSTAGPFLSSLFFGSFDSHSRVMWINENFFVFLTFFSVSKPFFFKAILMFCKWDQWFVFTTIIILITYYYHYSYYFSFSYLVRSMIFSYLVRSMIFVFTIIIILITDRFVFTIVIIFYGLLLSLFLLFLLLSFSYLVRSMIFLLLSSFYHFF